MRHRQKCCLSNLLYREMHGGTFAGPAVCPLQDLAMRILWLAMVICLLSDPRLLSSHFGEQKAIG